VVFKKQTDISMKRVSDTNLYNIVPTAKARTAIFRKVEALANNLQHCVRFTDPEFKLKSLCKRGMQINHLAIEAATNYLYSSISSNATYSIYSHSLLTMHG